MITDWTAVKEGVRGRICFLVRGFDGGGAQRDAILLANELNRGGKPSAIVTLDAAGPLGDLIDPAVPLIDLGRGRKLRLALALGAFRRFLAIGRPHAIVASEAAGNVMTILAARLVSRRRRPLVVLREVASPAQASRNDPYWQNRLAYRFARYAYPLADRVITFTSGAKEDLQHSFGVPSRTIANLGTNAVLTPAMCARIDASPRVPEPGLIVTVGRLSPEKGYLNLIKAFGRVRKLRAARLIIVGEGSERDRLVAAIAAHRLDSDVTLAGHLADPLQIVRRAALYVCASQHEGLGNALIEAMACGVPVVSTDAPHGPREILDDGRIGPLVRVEDAEALAAAIIDALDRPAEPDSLRSRALDFTVEAAAVRFAAILDDLGAPATSSQCKTGGLAPLPGGQPRDAAQEEA